MRESISINIQEPPVQELRNDRSCLRRSCATSCGCLVFLLVLILVLLNILSGSGSKEVKDVPAYMPTDIDVYETKRIQKITVSDTVPSGRIAEVASYIPKIFLSSIYVTFEDKTPQVISKYYDFVENQPDSKISNFIYLLRQPISPQTQQIDISWSNLPAKPSFIQEFYMSTLKKEGYDVSLIANTDMRRQLFFEKNATLGTIMIHDTNATKGTDTVQFTITLPLET